MSKFTHLHVHTQYSILDGASKVETLLARTKELGMDAIAITDHGNMFGVKHFHEAAAKAGIKPILGCETYVARRTRHDKTEKIDRSGYHLILLAKNPVGYHNLTKMISYSWTEGEYYRPRIDRELLEKYHEGLICCSACLGGEIQQTIMAGDLTGARERAKWHQDLFGEDYYLELQVHKSTTFESVNKDVYENQLIVNKELLAIGEELGIKCIASNDIHFVNEEDAVAHDHLICLNTGKNLDDMNRMHYTGQEFLKSYEQMAELFPDHPELLSNTQEITDKIEIYSLSHKAFMPNFPLPDDFVIDPQRLKNTYKEAFTVAVEQAKDAEKREKLKKESESIFAEIDACDSVEALRKLVEERGDRWNPAFEAKAKLPIAEQFLYLYHITMQGAHKRYGEVIPPAHMERIEFELATIERMGFPGYFLIVWDFIRAAREMGVSVGPGRGSAAGSVVAYCLKITNIDPIKYDLLFERFLNPERISMPDIDIDFDEDGRELVMKYVVDKYGAERVAHIITFGKMGAKNAIRDVARVQQLPLPESDRLSKLVPEKPGTTLAKAYKEVPELAAERESNNPLIRNTLKYADTLEGSVRQTGVHACGIIIGKDDLENFVPVCTNKETELHVVQYDGHYVEDIGLLKMDFLGLRTLSIIKDAVANVKQSKGIDVDIDSIPLDDQLTFDLYSRGDTTGIFQFESPGMKKYLRLLKPNRLEDLIAMNALYRPGPMEYIPDFIDRKYGRAKIEYDLEGMDEFLENTYGITVYQEQVMLLSQKLAGFTKGQADTLRKAMGKKKKDVLDKMKGDFIKGATERGYDEKTCNKVWSDWEAFASYAFNKSHSTCYAYVSYQTAYMKAHYPSEFMAAILSRNFSDIKKISFFMDECRRIGRKVLGPDVNASQVQFSVDESEDIRFGLSAIKGVGTAATAAIIEERQKGGKFKDIFDFVERIDLRTVGKKTIENLICAGAFDSLLPFHRSLALIVPPDSNVSFLDRLVSFANDFKQEQEEAANSLFGDFETSSHMIERPYLPSQSLEPWSPIATLNKEKELIGMYVSAHPLDNFRFVIDTFSNMSVAQLENSQELANRDFHVAGMVENVVIATSKSGSQFCKLQVEGYDGTYEFAFFGQNFDKFRNYYYKDNQLLISGKVTQRYKGAEFRPEVTSIISLQEAKERLVHELVIQLYTSMIDEKLVKELDRLMEQHKGDKPLKFSIYEPKERVLVNMLSKKYRVDINSQLLFDLSQLNVKYKVC